MNGIIFTSFLIILIEQSMVSSLVLRRIPDNEIVSENLISDDPVDYGYVISPAIGVIKENNVLSSNISDYIKDISDNDRPELCPGCDKYKKERLLSELELKEYRLEYIKEQILSKMRMSEPPKNTKPSQERTIIPAPLRNINYENPSHSFDHENDDDDDVDDYYGKQSEVFLIADEESSCGFSSSCLKFSLSKSTNFEHIKDAILWIYKRPTRRTYPYRNQTIILSNLRNFDGIVIGAKKIDYEGQWVKIRVKNTIRRWFEQGNNRLHLQVSCKNCAALNGKHLVANEGEFKPFIEIYTKTKVKRRERRADHDCLNGGYDTCCRDKMHVEFEEIGFNFVVQPPSFDAYFCRGTCLGRSPYQTSHSIATLADLRPSGQDQAYKIPIICCSPTELLSLRVVTKDIEGTLHMYELPGMIIKKCGCL